MEGHAYLIQDMLDEQEAHAVNLVADIIIADFNNQETIGALDHQASKTKLSNNGLAHRSMTIANVQLT